MLMIVIDDPSPTAFFKDSADVITDAEIFKYITQKMKDEEVARITNANPMYECIKACIEELPEPGRNNIQVVTARSIVEENYWLLKLDIHARHLDAYLKDEGATGHSLRRVASTFAETVDGCRSVLEEDIKVFEGRYQSTVGDKAAEEKEGVKADDKVSNALASRFTTSSFDYLT